MLFDAFDCWFDKLYPAELILEPALTDLTGAIHFQARGFCDLPSRLEKRGS